jgi:hypothetical protein
MILCSRNKQNHKNKGETGILSMNFAFDLRGVGLVKATFYLIYRPKGKRGFIQKGHEWGLCTLGKSY